MPTVLLISVNAEYCVVAGVGLLIFFTSTRTCLRSGDISTERFRHFGQSRTYIISAELADSVRAKKM